LLPRRSTLIAAITVITVALPAIGRDLHLGESGLVLVSSGYGMSFGGLLLLGGRLADCFGRRRVFVAGMVIFGLASAGAGLAPSFIVLVSARFAEGAGAALAAPALLGVVFPGPQPLGRALAVWGVLSGAGAIAGTIASGVLITWIPWRWVFAAPAATAAAAVAATPGLAERRSAAALVPLPFVGRRAEPLAAVLACAAAMATAFFLVSLYLQQVRGFSRCGPRWSSCCPSLVPFSRAVWQDDGSATSGPGPSWRLGCSRRQVDCCCSVS